MAAPENRLKAALAEGRLQVGLWLAFAHPTAAEIASRAGFDWCLIDAEHGPNDIPLILAQMQAMGGGAASVAVRVPVGETRILKQVLDIGAQTVLVPMVDTAEQAAALVRAVHYPPKGIRGVGAMQSRATFFGEDTGYVAGAGDQVCLMVQAETRTAMANLDAIAAVEGVDCVFIGPADLAADMGHLGNPGHPDVVAAIEDGVKRIRAAGKAAGIITFDAARIAHYAGLGFTFLGTGGDVALFTRAVRDLAAQAQAVKG
ncbi:aldolase/citrate lyase family protein [Oceaniglobus roseus]|uniref:aldolase/citrate lyase family protein n=1 Tax=Oceaniglobus roseus TaxID=1737570 RepID=UPI0012FFDE5B|nr:aldolase/citrate lyase family protein [Kandeliimicrobium roseum]